MDMKPGMEMINEDDLEAVTGGTGKGLAKSLICSLCGRPIQALMGPLMRGKFVCEACQIGHVGGDGKISDTGNTTNEGNTITRTLA